MARPKKYPDELLERGVRLVLESGRPIAHVARDLGMHAGDVAQAGASGRGRRAACGRICRASEEREEIRQLRKENYELRRANEILKAASVFFAKELDADRPK